MMNISVGRRSKPDKYPFGLEHSPRRVTEASLENSLGMREFGGGGILEVVNGIEVVV